MTILKPIAKSTTRTLSVRLPATVLDELDAVRAKAEAAGFTLNVPEIIQRALQAATRTAEAELSPAKPPSTAKK